jgi:hypothetical protein
MPVDWKRKKRATLRFGTYCGLLYLVSIYLGIAGPRAVFEGMSLGDGVLFCASMMIASYVLVFAVYWPSVRISADCLTRDRKAGEEEVAAACRKEG